MLESLPRVNETRGLRDADESCYTELLLARLFDVMLMESRISRCQNIRTVHYYTICHWLFNTSLGMWHMQQERVCIG